jgi:hypothetical protein
MRNIKLTDGSVYEVERCGANEHELRFLIVSPVTMKEAVNAFDDPELTNRIEHYFDGTENDHVVFVGYTTLAGLFQDEHGTEIVLYKNDGGD